MYKFMTKLFGVLSILFGALFVIASLLPVKFTFLKKSSDGSKGALAGVNNNALNNLLGRAVSAAVPVYAVCKIKTILKDHKNAKRRRKMFAAFGAAMAFMGLKRKKKKSLLKRAGA